MEVIIGRKVVSLPSQRIPRPVCRAGWAPCSAIGNGLPRRTGSHGWQAWNSSEFFHEKCSQTSLLACLITLDCLQSETD
jgi:hypothetical protein